MAETLTAHFSWTKPDPGASASTWGTTLNQTIDKVDAQVFTSTQAGVPVGTIIMWAGSAAPAGWLLCDGTSLATAGTYATLFGVCGYTYGGSGANFNLPNLAGRFPLGGGTGSVGGEGSHVLTVAEMPVHAHTVNEGAGHTHGLSQSPHAHLISDPGHTHSASEVAHNHTVGGTSGAVGAGFAAGSGAQVATGTTSTAQPAITVDAAGTGITGTQPINANVSIAAATTGLSINNAGSGVAHNNLPPFLQINFIIRAL